MALAVKQARLVVQSELNPLQAVENLALFDSEGNPVDPELLEGPDFTPAEAVADIATADASDEGTTMALANANKAKINELLGKLRSAGLLASS